jgi:hypothetical protein
MGRISHILKVPKHEICFLFFTPKKLFSRHHSSLACEQLIPPLMQQLTKIVDVVLLKALCHCCVSGVEVRNTVLI